MASPTRGSSVGRALAGTAAAAAAVLVLAGAGGTPRLDACLVTGGAGPTSGPFGAEAEAGLVAAEHHSVSGRVVHTGSPVAFTAALRSCGRRGARVTIAAGFPAASPVDAAATALPGSDFALLDVEVGALAHRPKNVVGVLFAQQQAGYLVGYAAGLWAKKRHAHAVGAIGGLKIPAVERYLAGFQFGAQRADPGLQTLNAYSQDLADPRTCREKALDQIDHGSVVEFEVAAACGRGVLEAARARGVFAIGVGRGLVEAGPWVMTSALERIDVAVEAVARWAAAGTLRTDVDVVFDARRDGIGYDTWSPRVPAAIRAAVARQYLLLRSGKISGIPVTVK